MGTERVWAFRFEERMADIAVAKDAGSLLDCLFRSELALRMTTGYSLI